MNTFERELRKAVSAASREDRARYVGRAAYLELDSGLHAKLQFVIPMRLKPTIDYFDCLNLSIRQVHHYRNR